MRIVVDVLAVIGALTVVAGLAWVEGYMEVVVGHWWHRRGDADAGHTV